MDEFLQNIKKIAKERNRRAYIKRKIKKNTRTNKYGSNALSRRI